MDELNSSAISRHQRDMCAERPPANWRPRPTSSVRPLYLKWPVIGLAAQSRWLTVAILLSIGWLSAVGHCFDLDGQRRSQEWDSSPGGSEGLPLGSTYGGEAPVLSEPMALFGGEKPRIIPLVAADSGYSENSSVNILCTVSQGHHDSLTFDWFKDGQLIGGDQIIDDHHHHKNNGNINNNYERHNGNKNNNNNRILSEEQKSLNLAPDIEKHQDHSLLRISRVHSQHSGRYTCSVKNQFGQDSSSVNLIVNVKLQWIKEPPKEIVVSLNQELKVDCLAQGEPKPSMRWERLDFASSMPPMGSSSRSRQLAGPAASQSLDSGTMLNALTSGKNQLAQNEANGYKLVHQKHHLQQQMQSGQSIDGTKQQQNGVIVSSGRHLSIQRARESDSGIYECIASNAHDTDLRKLVHVQVRGPPKILPIATADSYPEGSTINLICTVSGGQRKGLILSWLRDGQELDEKMLKFGSSNVAISEDEQDISILRIKNATGANSGTYTCTARNPLGEDSTSVKININVEMRWNLAPRDQEIGLGQELAIDCDVVGVPLPKIQWLKHETGKHNSTEPRIVSRDRRLHVAKVSHQHSGLYECLATNGVHEDLRKVVHVRVRGE